MIGHAAGHRFLDLLGGGHDLGDEGSAFIACVAAHRTAFWSVDNVGIELDVTQFFDGRFLCFLAFRAEPSHEPLPHNDQQCRCKKIRLHADIDKPRHG